MRKFVLMAIAAIAANGMNVSAAPITARLYPDAGIVTEVDKESDTVTWTDGTNNWYFYGTEDWMIGDGIAVIMSDNGTENVIDDHMVGSPKYIAIEW